MSTSGFDEVTKSEPERSLTEPLTKTGGRNNNGRITTRHQGGGHKRRYRVIDFKRTKDGVPAKVAAIEYHPNRSARIALLHYADGAKATSSRLPACGSARPSSRAGCADIKAGNALPLEAIPTGTVVHNVELKPGRAARWPAPPAPACSWSRRTRATASSACRPGDAPRLASLPGHRRPGRELGARERASGKAGRSRWLGKRPAVRAPR